MVDNMEKTSLRPTENSPSLNYQAASAIVTKMEADTQLYRSRFLMLFLFVMYSMSNAFQWIEYAIITNIVSEYYSVEEFAINWTSMIYMASYIPLIFPANWILEKRGLRFAVLLGSFGTCLGSWVKCGSLSPDRFPISMLGQTIVAVSQVFILGIPSQLAGIWFSADEVSRACAVGVFGNQPTHQWFRVYLRQYREYQPNFDRVYPGGDMWRNLHPASIPPTFKLSRPLTSSTDYSFELGIALGFVLPPMIVPNSNDKDDITRGLSILFYSIAAITTVLFIAIVFLFKEKPPLPPSRAQAAIVNCDSRSGYWSSILKLIRNVHYMLLLITYAKEEHYIALETNPAVIISFVTGINVGVFYAISTLLNQMVLAYYPGAEENAGWMGLIIVISGMFGSVACGVLLDKTHKFKETTLAVYILSLCGMIAYTLVLRYGNMWSLFLMAGLLGFFMTGYLPLGFEFAAELTYPEAEAISSGLLNASAQVFGIIFTAGAGAMLEYYGDWIANISLSSTLVVGSIITGFIKSDLRRLRASQMPDSESHLARIDSF